MDMGEVAAAATVHMREKQERDKMVAAENDLARIRQEKQDVTRNLPKDYERELRDARMEEQFRAHSTAEAQRQQQEKQRAEQQKQQMEARHKQLQQNKENRKAQFELDRAQNKKLAESKAGLEAVKERHEIERLAEINKANAKKIAEEKAFNEKMRNATNAQERSRLRNAALKKHLGENTDKRITPSTIKASIARAGKSIPTKITNALDKGSEVDIRLKQSAPLARVVSRTAGGFASDVGKIGRNKGAPAAQVLGKPPKRKSPVAMGRMDYLTSGNFPGAEFVGQSYTQTPVVRQGQVVQNPDFVDRELLGRTVTPHILHPKKGNQQGNESALDRFSRML
jgi:hypothetical protein